MEFSRRARGKPLYKYVFAAKFMLRQRVQWRLLPCIYVGLPSPSLSLYVSVSFSSLSLLYLFLFRAFVICSAFPANCFETTNKTYA